jgi:amino acid transporter
MVGWGWAGFTNDWLMSSGLLGSMLAFVAVAVVCIFVGRIYSKLIQMFPLAAGEVDFTYKGLGTFGARLTGWILLLSYVSVAAWESIALSTAFQYLFSFPNVGYIWTAFDFDIHFSWAIVGVIGAVALTAINLFGVRKVATFQILILLLMIICGVIYFLGGLTFGDTENITSHATKPGGFLRALLVAPSMFIGFDMVAKSGEEIIMPLNKVSRVLVFTIGSACVWYLLTLLATASLSHGDVSALPGMSVAETAENAFHTDVAGKILIVGGICGIITSWNGFIVGSTRIIFAMGRARMLPHFFSKVHPTYKTPMAAVLLVGIICCISPFFGSGAFTWLVTAASLGTMATYLLVCIAYVVIRREQHGIFFLNKR